MAKIKITQTGSPIRRDKTQRATLVGLGVKVVARDDWLSLEGDDAQVQHRQQAREHELGLMNLNFLHQQRHPRDALQRAEGCSSRHGGRRRASPRCGA